MRLRQEDSADLSITVNREKHEKEGCVSVLKCTGRYGLHKFIRGIRYILIKGDRSYVSL